MSLPMPEPELRQLAKANNSVNVDLASYHELRWHDPYFLMVRDRWNNARAAWEVEWYVRMPIKLWAGLDIHNPEPATLPEPHAAVAGEYIEARKVYDAAIEHYTMKGQEP